MGRNEFKGFPVISLCGNWEKMTGATLKANDITVSESQMPHLKIF